MGTIPMEYLCSTGNSLVQFSPSIGFCQGSFWIGVLLLYETFCFISLSAFSLLTAPSGWLSDNAAIQTTSAIAILLVYTHYFELLEYSFTPIRAFFGQIKVNNGVILQNVPEVLAAGLAIFCLWDISIQFDKQVVTSMTKGDATCTPTKALATFGIHLLSGFQRWLPSSFQSDMRIKEGPKVSLDEAARIMRFTFGLLYLSYCIYKHVLKFIPTITVITFTEHALTHVKSNLILSIGTMLLVTSTRGILNVPSAHFLLLFTASILLMEVLVPWEDLIGTPELTKNYDQKLIRNYSFWVHGLFFLLACGTLPFLFFGVNYRDDKLILFGSSSPVTMFCGIHSILLLMGMRCIIAFNRRRNDNALYATT